MDAKTMCRRQATGTQTTPAFDALLHRPFIRDDSEILPVWTRYLAGRKDADFQALVCHYLPLVLIVASALKCRANGAFREDTDAYLSDGILGLCRAIRYIKSFDAEKFGGSHDCGPPRHHGGNACPQIWRPARGWPLGNDLCCPIQAGTPPGPAGNAGRVGGGVGGARA